MSIPPGEFLHVNSFISIPSCQFIPFNSFMSIPPVNSLMSIPLFQSGHVYLLIPIHSFKLTDFNSSMLIQFISFQFTSFQLSKNPYKTRPFFETSAPARAGHNLVQSTGYR